LFCGFADACAVNRTGFVHLFLVSDFDQPMLLQVFTML
jgi:hypothetical protein